MKTIELVVVMDMVQGEDVTVSYTTEDGSAVAGVDYTRKSGVLTFKAGETTGKLTFNVGDPRNVEIPAPGRSFRVLLTKLVGNAMLGPTTVATVTIRTEQGDIIVGDDGPIILRGLITNSYHNELGRGGYFHQNSGTSEGQSVAILGALLAHELLADGTDAEKLVSADYLKTAYTLLDAIGDGSDNGAMLRQPVPTNPDTLCMLHWLFAARGDVPYQAINYKWSSVKAGNKLTIPAAQHGADVFQVWKIFPKNSYLLYNSPYSPTFDNDNPTIDTSVNIPANGWTRDSKGDVSVTIPQGANPSVAEWFVIYAYQNAGVLKQGGAYEAYPCWTPIDKGYAACAPDTFRWFDYALTKAAELDKRAGKAAEHIQLRDACRRTSLKGQDLTDLREIFKPMPQFDPIPVSGEPSGVFCYSNHPAATLPSAAQIAAGAGSEWSGFNFWTRVGGSGGTVKAGEYVWTPTNMLEPAPTGKDKFVGALRCTVPAGEGQVQIGRGINDTWREPTAYQEADQYMFLAISTTKKPVGEDAIYVYVSSTKFYDAETRWYANISQYADLIASSNPKEPCYILIPRTDFIRKDGDQSALQLGQRFENFGISLEMAGPYTVQVLALRMISGKTTQAVLDDLPRAVKGSVMPFFPGSMPFATNADVTKQQFVGWNGSPFHGYQQPDFWGHLEDEAELIHPNLNPYTDLPVSNLTTGVLEYPINEVTYPGVKKPKAALLMEQQLYFLQRAQEQYVKDGGTPGWYSHTFVLNTPARMSLGNPTPHTWVYVNDDPNTKWTGYLTRIVESLGRLVYEARNKASYQTVRGMAIDQVMLTLTALDTIWPNLDGKDYYDDTLKQTYKVYGMPTDFPDPRISGPLTQYEEPHTVALVLRACAWLKASAQLVEAQQVIVDRVAKRCYDYLVLRWHTAADEFQYTWANFNKAKNNKGEYYGFWIFEILTTAVYMLQHPDGIAAGIDPAVLRDWVVKHSRWIKANTK